MDSTPELKEALGGEKIKFQRFITFAVSTDERKFFYTRDDTYEAIQKRYDFRSEGFCPEKNIRLTLIVEFSDSGSFHLQPSEGLLVREASRVHSLSWHAIIQLH